MSDRREKFSQKGHQCPDVRCGWYVCDITATWDRYPHSTIIRALLWWNVESVDGWYVSVPANAGHALPVRAPWPTVAQVFEGDAKVTRILFAVDRDRPMLASPHVGAGIEIQAIDFDGVYRVTVRVSRSSWNTASPDRPWTGWHIAFAGWMTRRSPSIAMGFRFERVLTCAHPDMGGRQDRELPPDMRTLLRVALPVDDIHAPMPA